MTDIKIRNYSKQEKKKEEISTKRLNFFISIERDTKSERNEAWIDRPSCMKISYAIRHLAYRKGRGRREWRGGDNGKKSKKGAKFAGGTKKNDGLSLKQPRG